MSKKLVVGGRAGEARSLKREIGAAKWRKRESARSGMRLIMSGMKAAISHELSLNVPDASWHGEIKAQSKGARNQTRRHGAGSIKSHQYVN